MSVLFKLYRIINILSLDVVAGAVVSALFFGRIFSVVIRPVGLLALGLTVWIIYTADHLSDARNIPHEASTQRHRFHQRHFNTLLIVLIAGVILNGIAVFFIRRQVLAWGVLLAVGVSAYLIIQRSFPMVKEIFIAILYTCGIVLPSLAVTAIVLTTSHYVLMVQFVVIALINLLLYSWFDRQPDRMDKLNSFVTVMGEQKTRVVIWLLLGLQGALTLVQLFSGDLMVPALIASCMSLLLLVIFVFQRPLQRNDYYRFLGDAVFLMPLIYLL